MKKYYLTLIFLFTITLSQAQGDSLTFTLYTANSATDSCTGVAELTVVTGTPPFTYLWSNGVTTSGVEGLCGGNYSVTVTDASGDSESASFTITDSLFFHLVFTAPAVNGDCNGHAGLAVDGGTFPITVLWASGSTFVAANDLCAGPQTVTITDATGATASIQFTIADSLTPPINGDSTLSVQISTFDDIYGDCSGSAMSTVTGGVPPFQHLWSAGLPQPGTQTINLCPGIYSVTVLAANGDSITQNFVIADSASIYGNNNYQDSVPEDYLDGGVVENCEVDYANIDSSIITSIVPVNDTVFALTWAVYSDGNTTLLYDTLTYSGDYGVYELTLTIYCPEKSTETFAKLKDRVLINEFLAVDENALSSVLVYPNPFNSQVTISAATGNYQITLYDQTGRIVAEQLFNSASKMTLDTPATLNPGIYLLNISNGSTSVMKRIIK